MRKSALIKLPISALICVFLTSIFSHAETQTAPPAPVSQETEKKQQPEPFKSFDEAFQNGVKSYRAKSYPEAKTAFTQALNFDPKNPQTLTNLALVQYQLGEKGWAIALLRKALNINADLPTAKTALGFINSQNPLKEIPHEIELWESVRTQALAPISLPIYLSLTALFLLAAGWILLRFFGSRKRAIKSESPLPNFSFIGILLTTGFIIFASLTVLKIWDNQTPRATVVTEKVQVQAAPSTESPTLFELYSGLEVIVKAESKDWFQVTYPGGQTGWLPKSSVFLTSERGL